MNGIAALDDKRGSLSSHYKGVDTGSDDDSFYPGKYSIFLPFNCRSCDN